MNVLFKRLMNQVSDASGGGSQATGETSATVSLERGRSETPDYGNLFDDSDDLIPEETVASTVPGPEAVAPAETPKDTPPSGQTPSASDVSNPTETPAAPSPAPAVVTPPTQATPPASGAPAPAETPPAAATETPLTIEQHRERALPELQKLYQLSAEEAEELRVTPETALPKLASRLHFEVVMSAYQAVAAQLPQMVQGFMDHQRTVSEANSKFLERWPDLKDAKYHQTVVSAIRAYRHANPQANLEEIIERAGAFAMINAGLNPLQQQQQTQAPSVPAAPPRPAGVGATAAPLPKPAAGTQSDIDALVDAMLSGEVD